MHCPLAEVNAPVHAVPAGQGANGLLNLSFGLVICIYLRHEVYFGTWIMKLKLQ
jgi:hypothetical protein